MKIALIIERMDPARGGREASTRQIAMALAERGHEVTVLCQRGNWQHEGINVRPLGRRGWFRSRRAVNFVQDVQQALHEGAFDVSHAMLPIPGSDIYQPRGGTVPAQMQTGIRRVGPVIGMIRTPLGRVFNSHRRQMHALEATVAADTRTWCVPNSRMVADEFDRYYGRRQNVRVIFNGVDAPAWNERYEHLRQKHRFHLNAREDDVVLICPAKNYLLKGADHAILGFAKWHYRRARKTPTVQLLFVGRDNPEGLQRLAQMHEVGRLVQFLPPTDDIWPWYAAADGVLLLSWYDACSRVVLEAARWGIPSITTQYNGAAEILRDGGGWVIESPKDRQGLWASLDAILDTHQRQRASKACLAQAAGLSMQRHVDELETLYREILGR